jgi:aminoglycoside/choline kinase family phosphotransferase
MDKGKKAFAAHIPNGLVYLGDVLQRFPEFPLLRELVDQAQDKIKTLSTKL